MSDNMRMKLKIWRQKGPNSPGAFRDYELDNVSSHMSFLEMLDVLNEKLIKEGKEDPVEYDYDCREGICGTCGVVVDGVAHGPVRRTATCQLHMRTFRDGDTITIEPWRSEAFPVIKDLVVDRSAFDRIIQAGGYVGVNTGCAQDANSIPIGKEEADKSFFAAACIGCGACVAACPNASASLFVAAKISQYAHLPQGKPEATRRALRMIEQMDAEGFGNCSNHAECEAVCPKGISIDNIAVMRREYLKAALKTGSATI